MFSVFHDGFAQFLGPGFTHISGNSISARNVQLSDDFVLNFAASKQADGTWLIEAAGDGGGQTPPAQKPDLVVGQPTVSKSTKTPGETFTLSATVTNDGAGSAATTTLRYYRSTNTTISSSDTEVGTDSVSSLQTNRSSDESIRLTAPTAAGTYYYGACVDSVSDESNSNNNCSAAVSITVQPLTSGTEMTSDESGAAAPTVEPGDDDTSLDIEFEELSEFGDFFGVYYLQWRKKTPQGSWVSGCFKLDPPSLSPGQTVTSTVHATIGRLEPGTTYQVRYNNNTGAVICSTNVSGPWSAIGEGTTTGTAAPPQPDLVVESVGAEPSTVAPGEEFRLHATLRNQGTSTSAATTVRYYRSTDNIISTDDTQLGTGRRNPLAANASIRRDLNVTASETPGTYYYGVCVDSVPNESDTANNCSTAVSITVGGSVVSTPPHPFIYWTDFGTDKIQRANLDGSNVQDLVTQGLGNPFGIALDVAGGKMYWTDGVTDKIQRANLDGSNVQDLVTQGLESPLGIALDVMGGKMYWTDGVTDKIQRANLDGSNVQDLVTQGLTTPSGIALDIAGGKMYWTDFGTDKIQRANLDGSNVQDLVTQGLGNPIGIALDVAGGKMYWTDFGTDKIQRANLDGSNVQDLVTQGLTTPSGIALDVAGGKMYWTDFGTDKIQRANLDGSNVQDLVTQGLTMPDGIALGILSQPLSPIAREDVNGDRVVDVRDLAYIGLQYGKTGTNAADVNGDNIVNVDDFILVAAAVDAAAAAAPAARVQVQSHFTAAQLQGWLIEARALRNTSFTYQKGIAVIERLLALLAPEETALLANYPNPFNPETWIPYHLANDADVSLSIYDVDGALVRELDLGHQRAGYYTDRSRAAYWDGRNGLGEGVASGVYFYQLRAGNYSQMRKLVILK